MVTCLGGWGNTQGPPAIAHCHPFCTVLCAALIGLAVKVPFWQRWPSWTEMELTAAATTFCLPSVNKYEVAGALNAIRSLIVLFPPFSTNVDLFRRVVSNAELPAE